MGYDTWKQESDRDYEDRMHVHDRGPRMISPRTGRCACGAETTRSVAGFGWQCKRCSEAELQRIFGSEIAERTQRERNDEIVQRYLRKIG